MYQEYQYWSPESGCYAGVGPCAGHFECERDHVEKCTPFGALRSHRAEPVSPRTVCAIDEAHLRLCTHEMLLGPHERSHGAGRVVLAFSHDTLGTSGHGATTHDSAVQEAVRKWRWPMTMVRAIS